MSAPNQFLSSHLLSEDDQSEQVPSTAENASSDIVSNTTQQQQQLALPTTSAENATQQPNVSSSDSFDHTIKFETLGPIVVNRDGTLSRIRNWASMTESERERTVRVLGKRNMLRKEAILKDEAAGS